MSKETELITRILNFYADSDKEFSIFECESWLKEYAKEQWFFTEAVTRGYDYGKTIIHLDGMNSISVPQTIDTLKNPAGTFYRHDRNEGYFGGYLIYRGGDKKWAQLIENQNKEA